MLKLYAGVFTSFSFTLHRGIGCILSNEALAESVPCPSHWLQGPILTSWNSICFQKWMFKVLLFWLSEERFYSRFRSKFQFVLILLVVEASNCSHHFVASATLSFFDLDYNHQTGTNFFYLDYNHQIWVHSMKWSPSGLVSTLVWKFENHSNELFYCSWGLQRITLSNRLINMEWILLWFSYYNFQLSINFHVTSNTFAFDLKFSTFSLIIHGNFHIFTPKNSYDFLYKNQEWCDCEVLF